MKDYSQDPRMKNFDKIDALEFAQILLSLNKTKMPFYQQNQIVLQLYDRFYQNWEDEKPKAGIKRQKSKSVKQ